MQEIFEKIKERLEERQEKLDTDMWARQCDNWYGEWQNGVSDGIDIAIEIVNQVAEEYVPDINVGEIDEVCEWKIDGVYLHCQHDTELVISCLEEEEYRYKYCPVCGKKIKVIGDYYVKQRE